MVECEIDRKNLDELLKTLKYLGKAPKDAPEIKQAIRTASKYLTKEAKTSLRSVIIHRSTYLKNSPTYKLRKRNGGSLVGFKPLTYISQGNTSRLSGAAWWIDQGTKERYTKRGAYRGRITPTYFWTEIRNNKTQTAMDMIAEGVDRAISKIIHN